MKLQNISNSGKTIYLFCRDDQGKQFISPVESFSPYFYELAEQGSYRTITGERVKEIVCREPREIKQFRSDKSWMSDVGFYKRFLADKITEIEKSPIKYFLIDTEELAPRLPDYTNPIYSITCISVFNSLSKEKITFWINNYSGSLEDKEKSLLSAFIKYVKKETPDIIAIYNADYDYPYLYTRYEKLFGSKPSFAEVISPISKSRFSKKELDRIYYPAGISILDYLALYKKLTLNRKKSYALEDVAQDELGVKPRSKVNFAELTDEVKKKNQEDVDYLIRLEEKKNLISYYDEIRRISKCTYEDTLWNSKVIDQMILTEAKKRNIVLPNKKYSEDFEDSDEIKFEGAYRHCKTGLFKNLWRVDLTSAYPTMLTEFCLDIANIRKENSQNTLTIPITDRKTGEKINEVIFEQNNDTILPSVAKRLMVKKAELKKELKTNYSNDLQLRYDAYKGLVNSVFGVSALKSFRLFDIRVASAITSLVRDLLIYIEKRLEVLNCPVIYVDTDSVYYQSEKNLIIELNTMIQDWVKEKYNKSHIDLDFTDQGMWKKILIIALCHYKGIDEKNGTETRGIESKKKDSSEYIKYFQPALIDKILNEEPRELIEKWIKEEINNFPTQSIEKISFPARLAKEIGDYKTTVDRKYKLEDGKTEIKKFAKSLPIHIRAAQNSGREIRVGDTYLWSYVVSDSPKNNVIAFTSDNIPKEIKPDYKTMLNRNILMKVEPIFEALGWKEEIVLFKKKNKPILENTSLFKEKE